MCLHLWSDVSLECECTSINDTLKVNFSRSLLQNLHLDVSSQFPCIASLARLLQGRPGYFSVDDIAVGETIDVYGRRFHVVDASGATRRLLQDRLGRYEAPAIPFPIDRYSEERKEFMSRQTGCDPNVQHKIIKV